MSLVQATVSCFLRARSTAEGTRGHPLRIGAPRSRETGGRRCHSSRERAHARGRRLLESSRDGAFRAAPLPASLRIVASAAESALGSPLRGRDTRLGFSPRERGRERAMVRPFAVCVRARARALERVFFSPHQRRRRESCLNLDVDELDTKRALFSHTFR